MTPDELKARTLDELHALRKDMNSTEWRTALDGAAPDDRRKAAEALLDVQETILALENAQLAAIRDKLIANETALADGIVRLARARERLGQAREVIEAVGGLVSTVVKVVKIAGGV